MRQVAEDTASWRRELEEPATLVLAKESKLSSMLEGDALFSGTTAKTNLVGGRAGAQARTASTQQRANRKHHTPNDDGT